MNILLALFFFSVPSPSASSDEVKWAEGSIVLHDRRVITGQLSVNTQYDLVLFDHGDSISVYPAHRISAVRYFDRQARINRKFTVIQLPTSQRPVSRLFEFVYDGPVTVLRRQTSPIPDEHESATAYTYFLKYDGELILIANFAKRLYPKIRSEKLDRFIREKGLSIYDRKDIIALLDFFNKRLEVPANSL